MIKAFAWHCGQPKIDSSRYWHDSMLALKVTAMRAAMHQKSPTWHVGRSNASIRLQLLKDVYIQSILMEKKYHNALEKFIRQNKTQYPLLYREYKANGKV